MRWAGCTAGWLVGIAVICVALVPQRALGAGERGFEMVSPVDKNGGNVTGDGYTNVAAADGSAIAYSSRASFADTVGSGAVGQTQYIARRGASGWDTRAITPAPARESLQVLFGSTIIPTFADDLSAAIIWAYDLPGVAGDTPGATNLYWEDTATRAVQAITSSRADVPTPFEFIDITPWGTSSDARHVSIVSRTRLLPEAPVGVPSVYEWSEGQLRLASILPDGTPATTGATVRPSVYRGSMSADGSHITFVAPRDGNDQLYVRIDGERTAWVSQPEREVPAPSDVPADVLLQAMTDDGRHILFTTSSQLLDADTNDGQDLYLYTESPNPEADDNLTLISNSGGVVGNQDGTAVVGLSDDATRIYFQDTGNNLFLSDHGDVKLVTGSLPRSSGGPGTQLALTGHNTGAARVTKDGSRVAFLTNGTVDGQHGLTGEVTGGHLEMYLYEADSGTLRCVSCPPGRPATADASVSANATEGTAKYELPGLRPRFLSADGNRVFFSSGEALVEEDTNGVVDAYQYDADTQSLSLLSSGRGSDSSWFVDASASGDDVFFVTRQALVGADRDDLVDLYDARVGGGFPEPPPGPAGPCQGDVCQGTAPPRPGPFAIGTELFADTDTGTGAGRVAVSALRLIGSRLVRPATVRISMKASGRGSLKWSGRGLRRGSRMVATGGVFRARIVLSAKAAAKLRRVGTYRTRVRLAFAAADGRTMALRAPVTFKTKQSGKGR
jgi:Tol biopolymer transport system component